MKSFNKREGKKEKGKKYCFVNVKLYRDNQKTLLKEDAF